MRGVGMMCIKTAERTLNRTCSLERERYRLLTNREWVASSSLFGRLNVYPATIFVHLSGALHTSITMRRIAPRPRPRHLTLLFGGFSRSVGELSERSDFIFLFVS